MSVFGVVTVENPAVSTSNRFREDSGHFRSLK